MVVESLMHVGVILPGGLTLLIIVLAFFKATREESALLRIDRLPLIDPLTVIIPARNEEERIGPTLESLLNEPSEALRIVVYDDSSSDKTAEVVRSIARTDPRVQLIQGGGEPAVGFGKPVALARATTKANAQSECLLFLDADVHIKEGTLGGLYAKYKNSEAVISGCPDLICGSPIESIFVPAFISMVAGQYAPSKVHDDQSKTAFLNGQLIFVSQRALHAVGGFSSVTDTILEDVALGHRLKAHGFKLRLADFRGLAATRMYTSWTEIRMGFGKNACALFGGPYRTIGLAFIGMCVALGPLMSLLASVLYRNALLQLISMAIYVLVVCMQFAMRRRMQVPSWPVLLVPLIYLGVFRVLAGAAWTQLRGGDVQWKDRVYTANGPTES